MPYITQGMGSGEISIPLSKMGVPRDLYEELVTEIRMLKQVRHADYDGCEGWLKVKADLGKLTGDKLKAAMQKLEQRIKKIIHNLVERTRDREFAQN